MLHLFPPPIFSLSSIRAGFPGLRGHLGAVHAHHLPVLRHQDRWELWVLWQGSEAVHCVWFGGTPHHKPLTRKLSSHPSPLLSSPSPTDASVLRMLNGSPADRLLRPITDYITAKGGRLHTRWGCREVLYETDAEGAPTRVKGLRMSKADSEKTVTADVYVAALDVPGAKRLIPQVGVSVCLEVMGISPGNNEHAMVSERWMVACFCSFTPKVMSMEVCPSIAGLAAGPLLRQHFSAGRRCGHHGAAALRRLGHRAEGGQQQGRGARWAEQPAVQVSGLDWTLPRHAISSVWAYSGTKWCTVKRRTAERTYISMAPLDAPPSPLSQRRRGLQLLC